MTPRTTTPPCCAEGVTEAAAGTPVVALAGPPNVGKSTLFNALTGARRTMGNWPGTSVEVGRGAWHPVDPRTGSRRELALVDLPGAYSLDPLSPDEELTRDLLVSVPLSDAPDVTVLIADAAHLARSLYLVAQVREHALRTVVALTMDDVARHRGIEIDPEALARTLGCPVVPVDPRRRSGLDVLVRAVLEALEEPPPLPRERGAHDVGDDLASADERFGWIEGAVAASARSGEERTTLSERVDSVVTAPFVGPLIFFAVMWAVFQVTTTVAAPLQDWLDGFFTGPVTGGAVALLDRVGLEGTPAAGFVTDGLIAGVGMVLTFVPLMAVMFLCLAVLEDSGYMARAAVVSDRMMRFIGLPGRAFLPLMVGFGCNVPAISATRILPTARQRVLTALLVPFTSCSARLTVFVMLGVTFFRENAGTVVFAMYVLSIVLIAVTGLLLRSTLWRAMGADPLVIDLPPYQRPTARLTAIVTWTRLKGFLRTASGIIVATVCLVWLAQSVPVRGGAGFGEASPADSLYGVGAQVVAPAFEPAGFGSWQTTGTLVVGGVAKEAVIASWAQTYALEEPESEDQPGRLGDQLHQSFEESSHGHPLPAVIAFMVFLLSYTPCVATLAAQKREIGWRWTLFGVALQLTMAWALAVAVFQVGRMFW